MGRYHYPLPETAEETGKNKLFTELTLEKHIFFLSPRTIYFNDIPLIRRGRLR